VICAPALLPDIFAETPVPAGPISDEAAEAIARLLWQAAAEEAEQQANVASERDQG
jgi:hypothetical protein